MLHFPASLNIRHSYEFLFTHLPSHLALFLDRCFRSYPYYTYIKKDATREALRIGKSVLELEGEDLERFVDTKLWNVEKETQRDTIESFRILRAKLFYSKDFKHLLNTYEFAELEKYVYGN